MNFDPKNEILKKSPSRRHFWISHPVYNLKVDYVPLTYLQYYRIISSLTLCFSKNNYKMISTSKNGIISSKKFFSKSKFKI